MIKWLRHARVGAYVRMDGDQLEAWCAAPKPYRPKWPAAFFILLLLFVRNEVREFGLC